MPDNLHQHELTEKESMQLGEFMLSLRKIQWLWENRLFSKGTQVMILARLIRARVWWFRTPIRGALELIINAILLYGTLALVFWLLCHC